MRASVVDPFGCCGVSVRALFLRATAAIFAVAFAGLYRPNAPYFHPDHLPNSKH
jgi:hypothetical protein